MKITVTENKLQCFDYLVHDLCDALRALMAIPLSLSSIPIRLSSLRIPDVPVFITCTPFMAEQGTHEAGADEKVPDVCTKLARCQSVSLGHLSD